MENIEKLITFYENEGEEELRLASGGVHYLEFLTATKYLDKYLAPGSSVLDSCAGSGAYSFYLAGKGHRVTAGDVVPYNVDVMRAKQGGGDMPPLAEIYLGDALDLARFPDEGFGAVLLMGALYHLSGQEDRRRAVGESLRVLRGGGLFACTYMNRHAVILNNASGGLDNIDEIMEFLREGREGVFYASTPGGFEEELKGRPVEKLCHIALDGMACLMRHTAGLIDDLGLERWRRYHFASCEDPSLLGYSYHNMYIGRKLS